MHTPYCWISRHTTGMTHLKITVPIFTSYSFQIQHNFSAWCVVEYRRLRLKILPFPLLLIKQKDRRTAISCNKWCLNFRLIGWIPSFLYHTNFILVQESNNEFKFFYGYFCINRSLQETSIRNVFNCGAVWRITVNILWSTHLNLGHFGKTFREFNLSAVWSLDLNWPQYTIIKFA
jgi:hypothetical protein